MEARTVGRYELVRELGAGGMAVVHLAHHPGLDRFVAIKELRNFQSADPELALRFVREARVSGLLSHPNLVTVFDFFEYDGVPYIAMEYLPRGSLRPWMEGLTLPQIGGVLEGVLAGLAHAERRGIVHRDLKPENLLVTDDGRIKIADFGIAKALGEMPEATLTNAGAMLGTPAYMAPEQALGENIGPWTDMYAVGVIAYELFTGRRPFHKSPMPMLLDRPAPRIANPAVPVEISDWVDRLLVKDPASRTRSAGAAQNELEDLMSELLDSNWRRQAPLGPDEDAQAGARATTSPPAGPTPRLTPRHTQPATPPPRDLPPGPLFPGEIDVPTGAPTPQPAAPERGSRRRWLVAGAAAGAAVVGGVAAVVIASRSPGDARFKAAVAEVCKLAQAQQNARPRRTRALNQALGNAKTWQESQRAVYFAAGQSLRDVDNLSSTLLVLNAPNTERAAVRAAESTLTATSNRYRAYQLRLNSTVSAPQLAKTVAAFQLPDQVPVRVAIGDLGGPGCISQPPAPLKPAPLFSAAVLANIAQASAAPARTSHKPKPARSGSTTSAGAVTSGAVAASPGTNPIPTPSSGPNPTPPNPTPPPPSAGGGGGTGTVPGGG